MRKLFCEAPPEFYPEAQHRPGKAFDKKQTGGAPCIVLNH